MRRRDFLHTLICGSGLVALDFKLLPGMLHAAESYPANKITWISNTQPGGGFDIIPRALAPYLSKHLKELSPGCKGGDIVMKNEPAAAGVKAYTMIFKAEPDGYIIGGLDTAFLTDVVMGKINFDITQYTYLAKLQTNSKIVYAGKNGFKSWKELVEFSKKAPLKFGVGQFGRGNHIAGILLNDAFGLNAKFINTQSSAQNMSMIIRGDVHVGVAAEDSLSNLLESGEIRALLTFEEKTDYPGAVSLKELGHPEIGIYSSVHRMVIGPPGLPKRIRTLLIEAIKRTLADNGVREWARKSKSVFTPIYGDESAAVAINTIKYYQSMEGTLKKYLL